jgi:hypothetical protein
VVTDRIDKALARHEETAASARSDFPQRELSTIANRSYAPIAQFTLIYGFGNWAYNAIPSK